MAFFANRIPKHPKEHCKAFLEFSGLSQVASLNDVDNHCNNLIRSFTENTNFVMLFVYIKTSQMQRSIKYKGVIIWNNIPSGIRKNTFQKFKSNYKDLLMANY